VSHTNQVYNNQNFSLLVFINGYELNSESRANVVYDLRVLNPDKTIRFEQKDLVALSGVLPNNSNLQLSESIPGICFDEIEMPGDYFIDITLRDLNSKLSIQITQVISVIKFKEGKDFKSIGEFIEWQKNYYQYPTPNRAAKAFLYFASTPELNEKESSFWSNFYFFLEIFNSNKYMVSAIQSSYKKQDLKVQIYIIFLLKYMDHDNKIFLESLTGQEQTAYEKIKDVDLPYDLSLEPESGEHLDALWCTFMASGKFSAIEKITTALKLSIYDGALEIYKESKSKDDYENAYKDAVYTAAAWSIESNMKQHPLVEKYIAYIYARSGTDEIIRTELAKILD